MIRNQYLTSLPVARKHRIYGTVLTWLIIEALFLVEHWYRYPPLSNQTQIYWIIVVAYRYIVQRWLLVSGRGALLWIYQRFSTVILF
jgi:hypothetical protein